MDLLLQREETRPDSGHIARADSQEQIPGLEDIRQRGNHLIKILKIAHVRVRHLPDALRKVLPVHAGEDVYKRQAQGQGSS